MKDHVKAFILSITVAVLMTWPWATNTQRVLGARHLEAADHLWILWLARWSNPLVIDTPLIDPPTGYEWVVGDPIHVFIFGIGEAFGGVSVGLALVHISSCLLAAAAGCAVG